MLVVNQSKVHEKLSEMAELPKGIRNYIKLGHQKVAKIIFIL
jgi:hypothetical protein